MRSGFGGETWKTGAKYEGNFKDDMRSGKGTMDYDTETQFSGEWVNDKR